MAKTLISGLIFPCTPSPNFFREFYIYYLDIVPSYYPLEFKGKLMNQTSENYKKTNFGSDFGLFCQHLGHQNLIFLEFTPTNGLTLFHWPVWPTFGLQFFVDFLCGHCSKLSSYVTYRKSNASNLRK